MLLTIFLIAQFWRDGMLANAQNTESDSRSCYWPNGRATTSYSNLGNFSACLTEGPSHCCLEGETCLSNGLCFGASIGYVYRGPCTDKSWSAASESVCLPWCTDAERWSNVVSCGQAQVWCSSDTAEIPTCPEADTSTGGEFHTYPQGHAMFVVNSSSSSTSSASASASASAPTSTPTSTSCQVQSQVSEAGVAPAVPIGVGVGVGVPLAAAVAILGLLLSREKKLRQSSKPAPAAYAAYQHVYDRDAAQEVMPPKAGQNQPQELGADRDFAELQGH